jgi:hypothetical protein
VGKVAAAAVVTDQRDAGLRTDKVRLIPAKSLRKTTVTAESNQKTHQPRKPGPKCTVCQHEDCISVDEALIAGTSYRRVAERFDLAPSSVARHWDTCVPKNLLEARKSQKLAAAEFLLASVIRLDGDAARIAEKAESKGQYRAARENNAERRHLIELQARMAAAEQKFTPGSDGEKANMAALVSAILKAIPDADQRAKLAEAIAPSAEPSA